MKVCVSGKQENKRGKGLEVPCLVTVKVSEHILSKVEPIIKDLRKRLILKKNICFMKIALLMLFKLFLTVNIRNLIFEKRGYKRRRLYMSGAYMRDYRVLVL